MTQLCRATQPSLCAPCARSGRGGGSPSPCNPGREGADQTSFTPGAGPSSPRLLRTEGWSLSVLPEAPNEAQDWRGHSRPQGEAPCALQAAQPGQAPPLRARATGQELGRVAPLLALSAPSSFLQGPAWAGNGAYPDPIRMLAQLLPGAHGGRAGGGWFPGPQPPAPGLSCQPLWHHGWGLPPKHGWWEHSHQASPSVQAS